jgi:HK97 gp10 family phage protein
VKTSVTVTRQSKVKGVTAKYNAKLKQIIGAGGQMVMNEAKQSIQQNSGGGKTYQKYNPRRTHTASAEGQPPNTDTGFLVSNIFLQIDPDGLGADVESRADYSGYLEFGTSKMEARPYLQPALEANRRNIIRLFARLKSSGV